MIDPATRALLADFPARLAASWSAFSRADWNFRPPAWHGIPSEPLTPIEQLCHVRDVEIDGYHLRIARVLAEHEPVLANLDGERLARERAYATADPARVLDAIAAARRQTLALFDAATPAQWPRGATFDDARVTLRGLVHLLCSHDQQHLAGLQWLLARIDAAR